MEEGLLTLILKVHNVLIMGTIAIKRKKTKRKEQKETKRDKVYT